MIETTKRNIYADNAATTRVDDAVISAMMPYICEDFGNISQSYSLSRTGKKAVREARETVAECIGAQPDEVFFTSGGTESDNWALKGCLYPNYQKSGLVTSSIEHHAVLNSCAWLERLGCEVNYVHPTREGAITPEAFFTAITDRTTVASVMHVNNEIGVIEPVEELAEVAHSKGLVFHSDAVQSVGHLPLDMSTSNIDLLSASAHKFNGPKGIGFLFVRGGTQIAPFQTGGSQERSMRAGTENVAAIVGLAAALRINVERMHDDLDHAVTLRKTLLNELRSSGVTFRINGSPSGIPGIVSLSFANQNGERLLHRLDLMGIYVSTGSACDSGRSSISHVLKEIMLEDLYANGTIRISLSRDNTEEEMRLIAQSIAKITRRNDSPSDNVDLPRFR